MCGYRKGYFSTQVLGLLILSPIFGTSNPGLNSSVAPLTLESGSKRPGAAPASSGPIKIVNRPILELSPGFEVPKMGDRLDFGATYAYFIAHRLVW